MDQHCIKAYVKGRVQGVWFRAGTREQALGLGLTGQARNLPDGQVEVVACGDKSSVERLVEWLHEGTESARVDHVRVETCDIEPPATFDIA